MKNSHRETKKGNKMKPRWLGPYTVRESLGKGSLELPEVYSRRTLNVHCTGYFSIPRVMYTAMA